MKYLQYNEAGEIVGCYDVVPLGMLEQVVEVDEFIANLVLQESTRYKVVDGELEYLPPVVEPVALRITSEQFESGVVVDGVCYATHALALSYLAVPRKVKTAIVHTPNGDDLVEVTPDTVEKIMECLTEKLRKHIQAL